MSITHLVAKFANYVTLWVAICQIMGPALGKITEGIAEYCYEVVNNNSMAGFMMCD